VATLALNGAPVATISITDTVATLSTDGGLAVEIVAGDIVSLTAPEIADETIARLRFTFDGAQ
jgi:hypothetical protein